MMHVSQNKAQAFTPATEKAKEAAAAFIDASNAWSRQYATARTQLSGFLSARVPTPALGLLASDPMNMMTFGVMFKGNPGPGFIAVPGAVARRLQNQGLSGNAYFPDVKTPLGREVMEKMNAISRQSEMRPLLNSVPGVRSVALESGRVVLTRAAVVDNQVVVFAGPSALSPIAELAPVVRKAPLDFAKEQAQERAREQAQETQLMASMLTAPSPRDTPSPFR